MTKEEYHNVLNNIAGSFGTLKDQVNQVFEIGRALGLNDMQIGQDVRGKIKGLMSTSTIQRMLPETAKHKEFSNKPKAVKMNAAKQPATLPVQQVNRRLVVPQEPTIPPAPEVVREAEIIPERQPSPLPRIKFNTDTFRRELRIALINGDTVWLTYNNGEVIEMKER